MSSKSYKGDIILQFVHQLNAILYIKSYARLIFLLTIENAQINSYEYMCI